MARQETAQLNIRSAFARARVHEIAQRTGITATEIVEDALRGYVSVRAAARVGALVRRGPILVRPASDGRRISLEEANAALDAAREREP